MLLIFAFPAFSMGRGATQLARFQIGEGRYGEAIGTLQNAIRSDPGNLEARFMLGNLYFALHRLPQSMEQYKAILSLDPGNVSSLNNLGYVEQASGDLKKAIFYYKRAEDINPGFSPAYRNLGNLYAGIGEVDQAIREYKHLVILQPTAESVVPLATLYEKRGDPLDAIKILSDFLARNPSSGDAWQSLAQACLDAKDVKQALDASSRAVASNVNNPSYLLTDAQVAKAAGNLSRAEQDAVKIQKLTAADNPVRMQAEIIFKDVQSLQLERRERLLISALVLVLIGLAAGFVYVLRRGGTQETTDTRALRKWDQDLEALSDLQEIADFLLAYFVEFFKLPKGMFFLLNREGTELKCTSTNLKVVLSDSIDVNPDSAVKWARVHQGRPMTSSQAYKTSLFHDAFPNAKDACEKHDMRLMIPFTDRGKILGFLLLGGVTKSQFHDLLPKVKKKVEVAHMLVQRASASIETATLYEMSVVDEQTQVYNKRFFRQVLMEEMRRVEQYNQPCTLLMMDIDHFKQLNDTYGHQQGDIVLKELAEILKQNVREGMDSVSRYGGEEFAVILPAATTEKGRETAERIRLSSYGRSYTGLPPGAKVTVSVGVASYPDHAKTDWELIKAADQALYQSKKSGRNRVTVAEALIQLAEPGSPLPEGTAEARAVREIPPFHGFQFRFEGEIRRAWTEKYPISIAVLRVDNFEEVRKSAKLMVQLATLSQPHLRVIDFFSSNQDDSLVFMMSEKKGKEAAAVMDQICKKALSQSLYGVNVQLKLSAGVAVFPDDGQDLDELLSRAEAARSGAEEKGINALTYHDVKQPV